MTTHTSMDRPEILQIMFHPRQVPHTQPPPGATDIDIRVAPEATIGCRFFPAKKDAPTIIFFHGNGEIVTDYDDIGPMYTAEGLNFLVTDFRGYGWSTGSPLVTTLLNDSRSLFSQLREWLQRHGYSGPLFVMGRSLGSSCAIDVVHTYQDTIAGLIIESGFAQTLPLAASLGLDLANLSLSEEQTFANETKISAITKPIFILHGAQDHLIPLWQAEKLMAAAGARSKELQVIPGADHNTMIVTGGVSYFKAIKGFVDKVTGASDWRRRRRAFKQRHQS